MTDTITLATLRLTFSDGNQGNDTIDISLDGGLVFDDLLISDYVSSNAATGFDLSVSISLLSDGMLSGDLVKVGDPGDYTFWGSQLTVEARRNQTPPGIGLAEPGTLAIFGVGLLGLHFLRRRRTS